MVRKGEAERAGKGWELPKAASHAPAKAGVARRERGGERHCTKFLDTKMAGMASSVVTLLAAAAEEEELELELEEEEEVLLTSPHRQVNSGTGRNPEPLTLTTVPPPLLPLSAPE